MEQRSQCTVGPCRETLGRLLAGSNGVAVTHGQVAAILQRSTPIRRHRVRLMPSSVGEQYINSSSKMVVCTAPRAATSSV